MSTHVGARAGNAPAGGLWGGGGPGALTHRAPPAPPPARARRRRGRPSRPGATHPARAPRTAGAPARRSPTGGAAVTAPEAPGSLQTPALTLRTRLVERGKDPEQGKKKKRKRKTRPATRGTNLVGRDPKTQEGEGVGVKGIDTFTSSLAQRRRPHRRA